MGLLLYDGQKLPRGEINDYYVTPWGAMYWVDVPKNVGAHGWMTSPSPQGNRRGRMLNAAATPADRLPRQRRRWPASPSPSGQKPAAPQTLELTKADSGNQPGCGPATWSLSACRAIPLRATSGRRRPSSPALRLLGHPVPTRETAGKAGAGGTYVFQFQAVQPGRGPSNSSIPGPGNGKNRRPIRST